MFKKLSFFALVGMVLTSFVLCPVDLSAQSVEPSSFESGRSYYVSAKGNNSNNGLSESAPIRDLEYAVQLVRSSDIDRITVIGTLDKYSFTPLRSDTVFSIYHLSERQLLITGKPGATGAERAVLSGRDSGVTVVRAFSGNIRFENIEISGGEGEIGTGIDIFGSSSVTLGPGAVVRNNRAAGMIISEGTCVIDGGEVRENTGPGLIISEKGVLTMRSGAIRENRSPNNGGGVGVLDGGRFTMAGGSITGNRASLSGGGVYVRSGGRFDQTGGTISGNTATQGSNQNIFRAQGALGSNLTPGTSSTASSSSSSSSSSSGSSSSSSSSGFGWHIPLFLGSYAQGINANTFSLGLPLQLGVELNFGRVISVALLGEAGAGVGWPYILEYHYGGMAELYFANKRIGVGAGFGSQTTTFPWENILQSDYNSNNSDTPGSVNSLYTRFALILRGDSKFTLYGQYYNNGSLLELGNWGFGITWSGDLLE